MKWTRFTLICLVFLSVLLQACSTYSIQIGPEQNGSTVTLKEGENFTVTLPSNPSTGYSWQPEFDAAFLSQVVEAEFEAESSLAGAGGAEIFEFKAVQPGTTTLTLNYERPWEENVDPVETFQIKLIIEE